VAAVGALEAGESGREVAAAVELLDDVDGVGSKRTVGLAARAFVVGEETVPGVVDDLPERGCAGTPRAVDGRHKIRS